jgi:hypothetical protein
MFAIATMDRSIKKGDDEDDRPAASEQKPEPIKTPPAQEQPAAKERRIGRKR